jgi:hypothetical protein
MRYIGFTGYDTPISRDTIHVFRGIRYIGFTGYGTHELSMKRLETLVQQALQEVVENA